MKKSTHSLLAIRGIVFKTIAVLLVVCLLLPISAFAASDTTKENGSSPVEEVYSVDYEEIESLLSEQKRISEETISLDKESAAYQEAVKKLEEIQLALDQSGLNEEFDRLLSEQSRILVEMMFLDKEDAAYQEAAKRLEEVEWALEKLGAEFLTFAEVLERFGDKNSEKLLALEQSTDNLRQEIPESDINKWTSRMRTYATEGTVYSLQTLYATPKSNLSPLFDAGGNIAGDNNMHQASEYNVFGIEASADVSGWEVAIPDATFSHTLFDAVGSAIYDFNEMTEIEGPDISYSWTNITIAAFTNVKQYGESDDYQITTLVSTKAELTISYQIPQFTYITSQGLEMISPRVITGSETVTISAPGYDSDALAVACYTDTVMGTTHHTYVNEINITAGITSLVATLSCHQPRYIIHCE